MPRWNRREKPDYRHLKDATPESALVDAIRSPTYGEAHDFRQLAGFQARLTAMWGDRGVLAIDELVPAHEALRARDPASSGSAASGMSRSFKKPSATWWGGGCAWRSW
jgi:hypothetical protein